VQSHRRDFLRLLTLGACSGLPWVERLYADSPDDLRQPFAAQLQRLLTALNSIGEPLRPEEQQSLQKILSSGAGDSVTRCEDLLRPHVLLRVDINPEGRVTMSRGDAKAELVEHGWRTFLVQVNNKSADTSAFSITSPQSGRMGRPSGNDTVAAHDFTIGAVDQTEAESRWIALNNWTSPPMLPNLSGLSIEYRILQIYSRDRGQREASLTAEAGAEQQDLGFGSTVPILFQCLPSNEIRIHVHDPVGAGTTASLLISDAFGRLYPAQGKRALPDLWFQPQIYRENGESIFLADGFYSLTYGRGPEYIEKQAALHVQGATPASLQLDLERWVQPKKFGYYSGDSHIHAAGCSHYESPTEGVTPEVMRRQVEGEALDVGSVLNWAPGWYYQSRFFTGHADHSVDQSPDPSLLQYDVEVSGFPSSHSGHLVLLRLSQESYPDTKSLDDWPSWNLPVLQWAKSQGAITGYAHTGWGMVTASTELPNYLIPAFDSCGANECIVDVTHPGMIDFMSGCDLWPFVELNIWYHILNCGFSLAFAGETDFPCITDHCVGGGRSYVHLDGEPSGDQGYSAWVQHGMKEGRSYFGDGRSHIFDFVVRDVHSGDELHLEEASDLHITATACAWLAPDPKAGEKIRGTSPYHQPCWHVERARIGDSREVAIELVVNGLPVQRTTMTADGTLHPVQFTQRISRSSWVALRIYPSCHTNPVVVLVADKPVRASRKSAQWCRSGVDACWEQKRLRIRPSELQAAAQAYDHARAAYDRIIAESDL
jgi:hypothetical protein